MIDISEQILPFARQFPSYAPIEPPEEVSKRLKIPVDDIIKLDANENPYGVPRSVKDAVAHANTLHAYPDPAQREVRRMISEYVGVPTDWIAAGTGSDELLDLICRIFLNPGDRALTFPPTFSYYKHVIALNHAHNDTVPLGDIFEFDFDAIQKLDVEPYKIVFLCSPNNPTGLSVPERIVDFFLRQKRMIVVIDEAYYEFCGKTHVDLLKKHPNVIILRTFSKFFALAGFRIGYGLMHPKIASAIMGVKPPYSVSVPSEIALKACFDALPEFKKHAENMKRNRNSLITELGALNGLTTFGSESNFFLCRCDGMIGARQFKLALEKYGIIIRHYPTSPELHNFIRISVGTKKQCDRLVGAMRTIVDTWNGKSDLA